MTDPVARPSAESVMRRARPVCGAAVVPSLRASDISEIVARLGSAGSKPGGGRARARLLPRGARGSPEDGRPRGRAVRTAPVAAVSGRDGLYGVAAGPDGRRRFRRAYVETGLRGTGKSAARGGPARIYEDHGSDRSSMRREALLRGALRCELQVADHLPAGGADSWIVSPTFDVILRTEVAAATRPTRFKLVHHDSWSNSPRRTTDGVRDIPGRARAGSIPMVAHRGSSTTSTRRSTMMERYDARHEGPAAAAPHSVSRTARGGHSDISLLGASTSTPYASRRGLVEDRPVLRRMSAPSTRMTTRWADEACWLKVSPSLHA